MKINKLALFVCCLSVVAIASADLEDRVSVLENQASLQALENNLSFGGMVNSMQLEKAEIHMVIITVWLCMLAISLAIQFV